MENTLSIYKKELRDMFRDKRVRSTAIFTPMLMMCLFLFMFGFLQDTLSKPENIKIHVVKGSGALAQLLQANKLNVIEVPSLEKGEELIKSGQAHLLLDYSGKLPAAGSQAVLNAYFDPKQDLKDVSLGRVKGILAAANKQALKEFLKAKGYPEAVAEPLALSEHEILVGAKGGASQMVISLLPYLIVIWAFAGGMSIASELVAGEKEKNTLETLLISPASRTQIAAGKFLSVATICLMSSFSAFLGLFIIEMLHLPMTKSLFPDGLGVSVPSALLVLAILVPAVCLFSGLLLAISTYAKNTREAQGYLVAANFVVLMPAISSQFIGFTDFASSKVIFAIPVLNTATSIRQILQNKPDMIGIATTIAVSLVLGAVAVAIAVKLFNREQVLTRV